MSELKQGLNLHFPYNQTMNFHIESKVKKVSNPKVVINLILTPPPESQ